jgi:hypothetical protein
MLLLMVPVGGSRRKRRFGRYALFVLSNQDAFVDTIDV